MCWLLINVAKLNLALAGVLSCLIVDGTAGIMLKVPASHRGLGSGD